MANAKEMVKLCDALPADRAMVIEVLKQGIIYDKLLDTFEWSFVFEAIPRFAQFGLNMTVVGDQWKQYRKLAAKLNIPCLPELPPR